MRSIRQELGFKRRIMKKAFTLVELMVAVGILAIILSFSGIVFHASIDTYRVAAANSEIMVTIMIETREAVEAVDEIISVPGIDCVMIGPGDLAVSLGCFPELGEEHEACLMRVLEACQQRDLPMGMACSSS